MSFDVEPWPIENNLKWEEGSPQWLERYEYIEARAEVWFNHFRDDPKYDFTKTSLEVRNCQKSLEVTYKKFAAGGMALGGI